MRLKDLGNLYPQLAQLQEIKGGGGTGDPPSTTEEPGGPPPPP